MATPLGITRIRAFIYIDLCLACLFLTYMYHVCWSNMLFFLLIYSFDTIYLNCDILSLILSRTHLSHLANIYIRRRVFRSRNFEIPEMRSRSWEGFHSHTCLGWEGSTVRLESAATSKLSLPDSSCPLVLRPV